MTTRRPTLTSIRKAARFLAETAVKDEKEKLQEIRMEVAENILDKYVPEIARLAREHQHEGYVSEIMVAWRDGDTQIPTPFPVPYMAPIRVSTEYWLAIVQLDSEAVRIKRLECDLEDKIMEEILMLGEEGLIERYFPEAYNLLEYREFVSDIDFLREKIRKGMATEKV